MHDIKQRSWGAAGGSIAAVGFGLIALAVFFACYIGRIIPAYIIMFVIGIPLVIVGIRIAMWEMAQAPRRFRLENFFDEPVDDPSRDQVEKHIMTMMTVGEEHVLLSLKGAGEGVNFVQAVSVDGGYDVQLGIGKNGRTELVSKLCSEEELFRIFMDFYDHGDVKEKGQFVPVEPTRKTYSAGEGKPPIWIQPIIETGKMYDLDFFHFTNMLDWSRQGDDAAVLEPLVSFLTNYGDNVIFAFDDKMAELLYSLDTYEIAKPLIDEWGLIPTDEFLYARCTALINGKSYYSDILKGKKKLSSDCEFESLLYVPRKAWCRLHDETDDNYPHITEKCYETYSNSQGWKNAPQNGREDLNE